MRTLCEEQIFNISQERTQEWTGKCFISISLMKGFNKIKKIFVMYFSIMGGGGISSYIKNFEREKIYSKLYSKMLESF